MHFSNVSLRAAIDTPGEVIPARRTGARGIGLFRLETSYRAAPYLPNEEQQVGLYEGLLRATAPHPLTLCTLDVGAEHCPRWIDLPAEANPALGWRSVRIMLEVRRVFLTQLRAALRASVEGPLRLVVPMIGGLEDLHAVDEVLIEAREGLRKDGLAFDASLPVGLLVQVPAAVVLAERLARLVDFFLVESGSLIQYLLAVDPGNARVATRHDRFHPAVWRAIVRTVRGARAGGISVGVTGPLAEDPIAARGLAALGVDEFVVRPSRIRRLAMALGRGEGLSASVLSRLLSAPSSAEIRLELAGSLRRGPQTIVPRGATARSVGG